VLLAPLLAALASVAATVYPPSVAATMPRLVKDRDLPTAVAARSMIQSVSIIVGPAGGALLLLLGSPAAAFGINALTFAASALFLLGLPAGALFRPRRKAANAAGVVQELREGVVAVRRSPVAWRLITADVVCSLVYGAQTVLLLLVGDRLGYGAAGYGYLLAGLGVGGVVGAGLAARLGVGSHPLRAVGAVLFAVALPTALLAVAPWLVVAIVLAVAIGAASVAVEVVVDTALARSVDEAVLARAYGLAFPVSLGGILVGSVVAAPLVGAVGVAGALVAVGGVVAAYAAFLTLPALVRSLPALVRSLPALVRSLPALVRSLPALHRRPAVARCSSCPLADYRPMPAGHTVAQ
jgi:predicted MFS family arabinose efflux permease